MEGIVDTLRKLDSLEGHVSVAALKLREGLGQMKQGLQRIPWDGTVRELGTVWTLTRPKGETVRCFLTTHPDGWELRLERNGKPLRAEAFSHGDALLDAAKAWRREF